MAKGKPRFLAAVLVVAALACSCTLARSGKMAAQTCPQIEFGAFQEHPGSNARPIRSPQGKTIFFERTPITRLHDISLAQLGSNEATVLLSFKADAAERTAGTGR